MIYDENMYILLSLHRLIGCEEVLMLYSSKVQTIGEFVEVCHTTFLTRVTNYKSPQITILETTISDIDLYGVGI